MRGPTEDGVKNETKNPARLLAGFFYLLYTNWESRNEREETGMEFNHPVRVVRTKLKTKRALVTSDIHGSLDLFKSLLEKLEYKPGEDTLVIIGDLVQKGRQNLDTVRFAMELSKQENVFVLMGNNDLFTLEGPDKEIFEHGSYFRERSVLGEMALAMDVPFPKSIEETHTLREKAEAVFPGELAFLRGLPHILETDQFLFAHAGLESEDLEHQTLEYVLSAPTFHETVKHTFQKLLLVGHWPVANYRTDRLSNAPLYHEACNVLSIDGGNTLKSIGQLNGVILDNETGEWDWAGVNGFPKIQAPCSQKAQPGAAITWPRNWVEVLERGKGMVRCRAKESGVLLDIPDDFLYEDKNGGFRTSDITNALLGVEKGETVSVVREFKDRLLIVKNGEAGFLFLK